MTRWDVGTPDDDSSSEAEAETTGEPVSEQSPELAPVGELEPTARWPLSRQPEGPEEPPAEADEGHTREHETALPRPATPSPNAQPSAGVKALLIALGVLVVVLLVLGGIAFKLWSDRIAAQQTLRAAVGAMSATVSPDIAITVGQRLERVRAAVDKGRFVEATSRLQHITEGTGRDVLGELQQPRPSVAFPGSEFGPAPQPNKEPQQAEGAPPLRPPSRRAGRPPSPSERPQPALPPATVEFFEAEPRLAKLFTEANRAGAALSQRGGDVAKLRDIRSSIVEAARLGDTDRVLKLMDAFRDELRTQAERLGVNPERRSGRRPPTRRRRPVVQGPPREFVTAAEQVREALAKAREERKDLRKAMTLLRQADQAAATGNFSRAVKLSNKALEAIKGAPEMPPEPELFRNPLVAMFINLLHVEDEELAGTLNSMREAYDDAKTATVDRLAASLKGAIDALGNVGKRRQAFGKRLEQIRGAKLPTLQDRDEAAARMRERMETVRGEIGDVLARVQGMSPDEFAADRDNIVDELLKIVFPRPARPGEPALAEKPEPGAGEKPAAPETAEALAPEQRVRAKLLSAAEPYLKVKADPAQKELATELGELFARARSLLTEGKYEEAELLTDNGLALLARLEPEAPGAPSIEPREATPAPPTGKGTSAATPADERSPQ